MALRTDRRRERGAMGLKILLVYLFGDFAVSAGLYLGYPDTVPDGR